MANKVIHKEQAGNVTQYYVIGLMDSDFFDTLVKFFLKHYGAKVSLEEDGIHRWRWQLRCRNEYCSSQFKGYDVKAKKQYLPEDDNR